MTPALIEHDADLIFQAGERAIETRQFIPQEYLDGLRRARDASFLPTGDTHRVASIPMAIVETWQRQGFDVFRESAQAIIARLKLEALDCFLTSNKAI